MQLAKLFLTFQIFHTFTLTSFEHFTIFIAKLTAAEQFNTPTDNLKKIHSNFARICTDCVIEVWPNNLLL